MPDADEQGCVTGWIASMIDVTERKQMQEELSELTQRLSYHVDNSPLAVMSGIRICGLFDGLAKPSACSAGALMRLLASGWKISAGFIKVTRLKSPRSPMSCKAATATILRQPQLPKRGAVIDCEWYNSSLLDDWDKLKSILSLVLNVTERKRMENDLRKSRDDLELRAGWAFNLFEFRQRRPILRFVLSVPLSIAICPMLSYLLGRFLPYGLAVFYIGVTAACALLLGKDFLSSKATSSRETISKNVWIALILASLWGVVSLASTVDLQIGDQLYPSIIVFDHSVRTSMTVAVARHIPPDNPFFAHSGAPLRYHYLWLLFCSLPMKVIHLSARHVVNAGVFWSGIGLMCTLALGLKFLVVVRAGIEITTILAVALLGVTGLDILRLCTSPVPSTIG